MEHDNCWGAANNNECSGFWNDPYWNIYDYTCHANGDVTCSMYDNMQFNSASLFP